MFYKYGGIQMNSLNTNEDTNTTLEGIIKEEGTYSHEIHGEKFYTLKLGILRLSGYEDVIPITFSERSIQKDTLKEGKKILIRGQIRTYNKYKNGKTQLIITVFAREIEELEEFITENESIVNEVTLTGYICKNPIYRKTPLGREITDLLVAVNRNYDKSDYVPSVVWGRNARYCKDLEIGSKINLVGRIQSRIYEKQDANGNVEKRAAYELSISSLQLVNLEETV